MYIYYIRIGNQIYFGQTHNPKQRWACHKCDLKRDRHTNKKLQEFYNNSDDIEYNILHEGLTPQRAAEVEREYIANIPNLNISPGGGGRTAKTGPRNIRKSKRTVEEYNNSQIITKLNHWLAVKR